MNKLAWLVLAAGLVGGCAQENAPRSFVQPNVIKKSDLAGTWYYLQTVTDAPPTSPFMFVGQSSELMKIKFDIEENMLYARRSYEQVADSEDTYKEDPAKYEGQPVAAWPIKSQFDIIRDYNSTTGEESNKIIESQERPWNEREFIRVDWSQNQVTDYVGLGVNFFFDDATVSNVSYWESDPTKPDAIHFERAEKDNPEFDKGEADYFDVTNKLAVNPAEKQICYEENGAQQCFKVPACFLRQTLDDCATQVVKVRHAFAKISPKHDYQPRTWDGTQMNLFGIWDVGLNRLTYNRQYGVTNTGIQRHAARFNVWKKSYQDDHKTPIPYNQRELRTIPYYAESSLEPFPPELFDVGKQVIASWNDAVKCAVADVQGYQTDDKQCDPSKVPDIFVWCHNPVQIGVDPDACKADLKPELDAKGNIVKGDDGNPIYRARQGDPRRSTIFWVNQDQAAGPLGYGPPLFDIETGETISGQAYIYGGALDRYAALSRDIVELMLGQQSSDDFVVGANIKEWVAANRAGVPNKPQTLTADQVRAMYKAMDFKWARGQAPEAPIDKSSPQAFINSWAAREDAMYKSNVFGQNQADIGQVRRDKLRGSLLEAMMITPDIMAMGGASPATDWTSLSDAEKARVSPLRSQAVRQAIEARLDKMRAFGFDFADFADEGIAQRALQLAQDPATSSFDPEAIRQRLRKDIFYGVTLHEVGHNMGLRHNFRASFDSLNYFKEYWDLRSAAATSATMKYAGLDPATQQVIGVPYAGTDCSDPARKGTMRPRYVDCPGGATSVDEVLGHIREYQYSSIMDYGAAFNSDLQGLGRYDRAAMKFSYAGDGFVEVFRTAKQDNAAQLQWAALHVFMNSYGLPSPLGLGLALTSINYTTYPSLFTDGVQGIDERMDVPYSDITPGGPGGFVLGDSFNRPLVPYYFCSDEFVGNLTCQRFDAGADAFEQAQDIISRYKNFYLLNNFKRDRYTFHTSLDYKSRIATRYLDMLRQQLTWYVLLRADFTDFEATNGGSQNPGQDVNSFFASEDGWGSFTAAVSDGFDLLGQIISQPEAGNFVKVSSNLVSDYPVDVWKKSGDSTSPLGLPPGARIVNLLDGKYIDTTWDFNGCGYYWADECQTRIGYFVDKTVALDVLSQSQAYFTGRDTSTDVRKYAIGYILPFRTQIEEKIGALLANDFSSFAPYFKDSKTVANPGWALDSQNVQTRGAGTLDLIDPAGGFTLQLYAGLYGLSAFPTTFDHSFIDTTRIFVVGNGEAPVPDSELLDANGNVPITGPATRDPAQLVANGGTKQWLVFTDSVSGKSYAAQSVPKVADGSGPTTYRIDTGARMLETAMALDTQANTACTADANGAACAAKRQALEKWKQNVDVMRSLHNAFGYATYKTDAPFYY